MVLFGRGGRDWPMRSRSPTRSRLFRRAAGGGSGGGGNGGENPPESSAYPSWLAADDLTFAAAGDHALVEGAEWESTFMLLRNHRGDTVAVVEPNGTFREVYVYGLWGDSTVFGCTTSSGSGTPGNTCTIPKSNSTLGNSSQFAGTHRSPLTNLYHMGARWYSTALRQFNSRDPLGQAVSFDEWLYTVGDPMNFVDRSGLSPNGVMNWEAAAQQRWKNRQIGQTERREEREARQQARREGRGNSGRTAWGRAGATTVPTPGEDIGSGPKHGVLWACNDKQPERTEEQLYALYHQMGDMLSDNHPYYLLGRDF